MKIFLKILKYTLYGIPALMILTLIVRVATSGDPPEARHMLNTGAIESAYRNLGGEFALYSIRVRNPFTHGDTFRVVDVMYFESARDLQITLRSKKNRFENLWNSAGAPAQVEDFHSLLKLYMRVTTNIYEETDGVQQRRTEREVFEVSASYMFENARYEYMRVNFSDVYIDYRRSRVDLFIFHDFREIDSDDLNNADYLGRVTIFDANMPRQATQIDSVERLN